MIWEILKGALVGGIIGWLTNQLAVWMMFHPKKPLKIGGSTVPLTPGLIVKNQERLADAIGQAVARDLLDRETLKEHLRELNLEPAIREVLLKERDHLREIDLPIAEKISTHHRPALEEFRKRAASAIAGRAAGLADRLENDIHALQHILESVLRDALDVPVSALVPEERRRAIRAALMERISDWIESDSGEELLKELLKGGIEGFSKSDSLGGVQEAFSDYVHKQIPAATDAIQRSLQNYVGTQEFEELVRPRAQKKLFEVVVSRFPMATMVLSPQRVEELMVEKWDMIVGELQKIVADESLRVFMVSQIESAADSMIGSSGRILGDPENAERVAEWAAAQIQRSAGEVLTREELLRVVDQWLDEASERKIGDFVGSAERLAEDLAPRAGKMLGGWLRGDAGRAWAEEKAGEVLRDVLYNEPISRLAELVPDDEAAQVATALARTLQERALRALPEILVEQVDLKSIVTAKVRQFDSDQIEETILRVSGRELKGIVRLGGLIGILVGASSPLLDVIVNWLR